jgi:hypothetical protein
MQKFPTGNCCLFERAVTQLVQAQEQHYWVSICDVIEYEVVPILELWQKLAERAREHLKKRPG